MPPDELKTHLSDVKAEESIRCLDFPLDNFSAWSSWHWKEFLNPESANRHWHADPRYFQNAASRYLYRLARRCYRQSSLSLDTIFCFIKIKQFEEDLLTSSAEGLGIGVAVKEVFSILGVES
jgi:vacuolar-type H+-ATPase subunit C/Vma6